MQGHLGTGVGPPVLPSHRHLRKLALHSKHLSLPPLVPPPPRQRERVGAVPRAAHSFLPGQVMASLAVHSPLRTSVAAAAAADAFSPVCTAKAHGACKQTHNLAVQSQTCLRAATTAHEPRGPSKAYITAREPQWCDVRHARYHSAFIRAAQCRAMSRTRQIDRMGAARRMRLSREAFRRATDAHGSKRDSNVRRRGHGHSGTPTTAALGGAPSVTAAGRRVACPRYRVPRGADGPACLGQQLRDDRRERADLIRVVRVEVVQRVLEAPHGPARPRSAPCVCWFVCVAFAPKGAFVRCGAHSNGGAARRGAARAAVRVCRDALLCALRGQSGPSESPARHWPGPALARPGTGPARHWPGPALARPGTARRDRTER